MKLARWWAANTAAVVAGLMIGIIPPPTAAQAPAASVMAEVLPGENSISDLVVSQGPDGRWQASFTYFYTGIAPPGLIRIELAPGDPRAPPTGAARPPGVFAPRGTPDPASAFLTPQPGRHQASVEIMRPVHARLPFVTTQLIIELRSRDKTLVQHRIDQRIEWPSMDEWMADRQWGRKSNDELLKMAIHDIDAGRDPSSLKQARELLERVLAKDPKCDQCHLELARIAMKTNWGPEGLRQAESYIATTRQIRPDSVNAKILLGYVYTHQKRFAEAEVLLVEASRTDTKNNWLWSNWGELLAMQGRIGPAIEKYREAMKRPRSTDTFDYARQDAYENLLVLLHRQKDFDAVESLYRQRAAENEPGTCDSVGYANFMLTQRGDGKKALDLMSQEIARGCKSARARALLGMSYYQAWGTSGKPPRDELLHQARIYLPPGAELVYLLASSDQTTGTLRALMVRGEAVDQQDNQRYNALAYAVQRNELETATRLLKLGAAPDARVGPASMPVALLPVLEGNVEAIRAFKRAGVDYSKIRHQGATALDVARQMGDRRVLEALGQTL